MVKNNFDITIIGAGPSGCAAALALSSSGLKVALVEKDNFPRDKICGDAIPGPAFKAMEKINLAWAKLMADFTDKKEIRTSKIFAPNGKTIALDWVTYSYNSKRLSFDNFLYNLVKNKTSTTLFTNRLETVKVDSEKVHCAFKNGEKITSKIIIGCDGTYSMVGRFLDTSLSFDKPEAAAVRAYYKNVAGVVEGVNEFHFFKEFTGYFWIFPLPNGETNVGFGIAQDSKDDAINLRESLEHIVTKIPCVASRFTNANQLTKTKGFGLPIWTKKKCISGQGFMLCGDAASLTDPLQGHGIDKGMWSGYFAAQQAISCFKHNKFDAEFMSNYDQQVYKKLGDELKRSVFFMRAILKFPWLVNSMVWMGQQKKLTAWAARVLKI